MPAAAPGNLTRPRLAAEAWESARAAAVFAAEVSLHCLEQGHQPGSCPIGRVARAGATRLLAVAHEIAS